MTAEKRPLPMTGVHRPVVYRHRITDVESGKLVRYGLWVVMYKSEIRYNTGMWDLAIYYAISIHSLHTGGTLA